MAHAIVQGYFVRGAVTTLMKRKLAVAILLVSALLGADPVSVRAPQPATTSEPATFALGGLGFTILFVIRRRRLRKSGHWPPARH